MLLIILSIILFLLAGYDAWITKQRMALFGAKVELNSGIRWLANKLGPELGAIIGVMAPATALIAVCDITHLKWVLSLMIGFRLRAFFNQIESKVFAAQIASFYEAATISPVPEHPSLRGSELDDSLKPISAGDPIIGGKI